MSLLMLIGSAWLPAWHGGFLFNTDSEFPAGICLALVTLGSVAWIGTIPSRGDFQEWPMVMVGVAWLIGTVLLIAGPLLIGLSRRWRVISAVRWAAPLLLSCWAYPLAARLAEGKQGGYWMYGYYVMCTAYTLGFLAILPPLPRRAKAGRGFEVIVRKPH